MGGITVQELKTHIAREKQFCYFFFFFLMSKLYWKASPKLEPEVSWTLGQPHFGDEALGKGFQVRKGNLIFYSPSAQLKH